MTRSLRPWIPAVLWAATIFVLSSFPGSAYPATNLVNADKLVHLFIDGVLGGLCARGFVAGSVIAPAAIVALSTALGTLYGITDELHQLFVPMRSCDWRDGVADAIGALVGAGVMVTVMTVKRRSRTPSAPEGPRADH